MGFIGTFLKGAVAKKVIDEARKPQNQAKIKNAIASMRNKGGSGGGTRRG